MMKFNNAPQPDPEIPPKPIEKKEEKIPEKFVDRFKRVIGLEDDDSEVIEKKELPLSVADRFYERFHLSTEDLEQIPGFNTLSEGRKLLVLENLSQISFGRMKEDALRAYQTDSAETHMLHRWWMGASKKFQIASRERVSAGKITEGGLGVHGEVLKQLVFGAGIGPDAKEGIDGKLEIQYLDVTQVETMLGRPLSEEEKLSAENFNRVASEYSHIPKEWTYARSSGVGRALQNYAAFEFDEDAGGTSTTKWNERRQQAEEVATRFDEARTNFLNIMRTSKHDPEAIFAMLEVDQRVHMQQFLSTHPKVEHALKNIKDTSLWGRAIGNTFTEKGAYFGLGFLSRSVSAHLLTHATVGAAAFAAPVVAAGVGALTAGSRATETLRERELLARRGEKQKRVTKKGIEIERSERGFVDATTLTKRIEKLLVDEETGYQAEGERRLDKLALLDRLVQLVDVKMKAGQVNFGKEDERLGVQYNLISALGRANATLGGSKRYKHQLIERVIDISNKNERNYIVKQMAFAGIISAGFAEAGQLVRDWFFPVHAAGLTHEAVVGHTTAGKGAELAHALSNAKSHLPPAEQKALEALHAKSDYVEYVKRYGQRIDQIADKFKKIANGEKISLTQEDVQNMRAAASWKNTRLGTIAETYIANAEKQGVFEKVGIAHMTLGKEKNIHSFLDALTRHFHNDHDKARKVLNQYIEEHGIRGNNNLSEGQLWERMRGLRGQTIWFSEQWQTTEHPSGLILGNENHFLGYNPENPLRLFAHGTEEARIADAMRNVSGPDTLIKLLHGDLSHEQAQMAFLEYFRTKEGLMTNDTYKLLEGYVSDIRMPKGSKEYERAKLFLDAFWKFQQHEDVTEKTVKKIMKHTSELAHWRHFYRYFPEHVRNHLAKLHTRLTPRGEVYEQPTGNVIPQELIGTEDYKKLQPYLDEDIYGAIKGREDLEDARRIMNNTIDTYYKNHPELQRMKRPLIGDMRPEVPPELKRQINEKVQEQIIAPHLRNNVQERVVRPWQRNTQTHDVILDQRDRQDIVPERRVSPVEPRGSKITAPPETSTPLNRQKSLDIIQKLKNTVQDERLNKRLVELEERINNTTVKDPKTWLQRTRTRVDDLIQNRGALRVNVKDTNIQDQLQKLKKSLEDK